MTAGIMYSITFTFRTSCSNILTLDFSFEGSEGTVGLTTFTTNGDPKLPDCNEITPTDNVSSDKTTSTKNSTSSSTTDSSNFQVISILFTFSIVLLIIKKRNSISRGN